LYVKPPKQLELRCGENTDVLLNRAENMCNTLRILTISFLAMNSFNMVRVNYIRRKTGFLKYMVYRNPINTGIFHGYNIAVMLFKPVSKFNKTGSKSRKFSKGYNWFFVL
jgi:hypothetical protein